MSRLTFIQIKIDQNKHLKKKILYTGVSKRMERFIILIIKRPKY